MKRRSVAFPGARALRVAALLVLPAPAFAQPTTALPPSPAGSSALPAPEIASRARKATVQIRAYDASRQLQGDGTGFFVASNGTIVTNLHVIRGAHSLEVVTLGGDVYDIVYYVTADARRDIAILKVPVDDARPLPLATEAEIEVGEAVYVMGNPLGQVGTFSNGLVSARRALDGLTLVQITAPVSPGSSGGPVMNDRGEVVGVTTLMLRGGQNLNYAVPVRYVRPLADSKEPPRRYAHEFLPATDRGLAALSAGPESRRSSSSARDRSTRGPDMIGRQFQVLDSLAETRGGESASDVVRGSLDHRGTAEHAVTLIGGHEYVIAGACDEDCSDLDLGIKDPAGRVLDVDVKDNDYPFLRFRVRTRGNYTLTVSMSGCAVEPCAYGIRLYRF